MVRIPTRNYQRDILEVLTDLGGSVTGFNKLQSTANFQPNMLSRNLKILEEKGRIKIEPRFEKNLSKYSIIEEDLRAKYDSWAKDLKEIERTLNAPDLSESERQYVTRNFMRYALFLNELIEITLLTSDYNKFTPAKKNYINSLKHRLFADINKVLSKIESSQRDNILFLSIREEPMFMSLNEYRERHRKPTRADRIKELLYLEKKYLSDVEKEPFCDYCGKKLPRNYKEGQKHIEKHLKEFEKTMGRIGRGLTFHCKICGKPIPSSAKKTKEHEESHKK